MENISIGKNDCGKIRIGLPKGNLAERSAQIIDSVLGEGSFQKRKLSYENEKYEFFLMKMRDIPLYVAQGILDYGITCQEWIAETGAEVEILSVYDWCDTRVSLIGVDPAALEATPVTCVTEYPNLAQKYFDENNIPCVIQHISGSSEAFVPNCFDTCVDCVETQGTLVANGLQELKVLLHSKIVLIAGVEKHDSK